MAARRKPAAPFYAVGVLWLLGGLFLPLYSYTAIALTGQVLCALKEVHENGYLHGDIQENNIFLKGGELERPEQGEPRPGPLKRRKKRRPPKSPNRSLPRETRSWIRLSRMGSWPWTR